MKLSIIQRASYACDSFGQMGVGAGGLGAFNLGQIFGFFTFFEFFTKFGLSYMAFAHLQLAFDRFSAGRSPSQGRPNRQVGRLPPLQPQVADGQQGARWGPASWQDRAKGIFRNLPGRQPEKGV